MYFALDICDPAAVHAGIAQRIAQRPDLHWMALVDGAFDVGVKRPLDVGERFPVFKFDNMHEMMMASPFLIDLADGESVRHRVFALAKHRAERPMLSFIGSRSPVPKVRQHLQQFVEVTADDGQEFILRFADTRILATLPDCLLPASWDGFSRMAQEWVYIDRQGGLVEVALKDGGADVPLPLTLSATEVSQLIEKGEPDAVINVLANDHIELLPLAGRTHFYSRIAAICAFAKRLKVDAFPDVVALAIFYIATGTDPAASEEVLALMRSRQWQTGRLIDSLTDLVNDEVE